MNYFVPDFDLEEEEDDCFGTITTSSAPPCNSNIPKISQSRYEDALLLELLWNQGPVVRPLRETPEPREPTGGGDVGPAAEAANQLFMEEDEMAKWLYHCQDIGGVSESQGGGGGSSGGGGGGDLYSEMPEPSSRGSSCSQAAEATAAAAAVRKPGSPSVVGMDVGKVFDAGSVRASVGRSSAHVSEKKRKAGPGKEPEYYSEVEYGNKRKDARQPPSTRTRAAEVHNLLNGGDEIGSMRR